MQLRAQLWTNGPSFSIFAHPPRPRNPNHVPRGASTMIAAPRIHVAAPSRSHRSGRKPSTIQSQQIDATMYTPPYAAYARPATAASTRVKTTANKASDAIPGRVHNALLSSRSQAQNAKHPPISPRAASAYQPKVFMNSSLSELQKGGQNSYRRSYASSGRPCHSAARV